MTTNYFDEQKKKWREDLKETWKDIDKFVEQQTIEDPEFVKMARLNYLKSWLEICEEMEKPLIKAFDRILETGEGEGFIDVIKEIHKPLLRKKTKIKKEIALYEAPVYQDDKITEQMIENARDYPIEEIIEINKDGFALCIDHNDKNPSMYCKNNYAHCFSCGYSGDTISVYMKVFRCSFIEAVKALQNS